MSLIRGFVVLIAASALLCGQTYTAVVAGSGYQTPPPIFVAPGQITTFFVGGLPQTSAGLAKVVALINVSGQNQQVPVVSTKVLDAETLAITVQFPFTGLPSATVSGFPVNAPQFPIQFAETDDPTGDPCAEGACTAPASLQPTFAQPHLINMCDLFVGGGRELSIRSAPWEWDLCDDRIARGAW
jgi:hypothetical protein